MLNAFAECHREVNYAKCHGKVYNAECRCAECCGATTFSIARRKCYTQVSYAWCRYDECRGAIKSERTMHVKHSVISRAKNSARVLSLRPYFVHGHKKRQR
jgi:hypothetical protein